MYQITMVDLFLLRTDHSVLWKTYTGNKKWKRNMWTAIPII